MTTTYTCETHNWIGSFLPCPTCHVLGQEKTETERYRGALEQILRMVDSPRPHGPEVSRGAIRAVAKEALRS